MLNEIMDRAMSKPTRPTEQSPTEDTPAQKEADKSPQTEGAPPSPPQKNKPSSVYIYLAVLFGAAFLMLLLAYFVQQRNSDAVLDDLRLTTASREELLEDIKELEEENGDLQRNNERLSYKVEQTDEKYKKLRESTDETERELTEASALLEYTIMLSYLERFINEKDYLMAACVAESCDSHFNKQNAYYPALNVSPLPTQTTRYMELRNWLEKNGHVKIIQTRDKEQLLSTLISENNEIPEPLIAARNLWSIFWTYPRLPDASAYFIAACYPDSSDLEQLNSKSFQPSTLELFEQIKADLIDRELLIEDGGILKPVVDGEPVDPNMVELE